MACNICSFNLAELCATTVALMKDPHHDIAATMPAPDFVGGGRSCTMKRRCVKFTSMAAAA